VRIDFNQISQKAICMVSNLCHIAPVYWAGGHNTGTVFHRCTNKPSSMNLLGFLVMHITIDRGSNNHNHSADIVTQEFDYPADATLMSVTDTESYIRYANTAFAETSGFSPQQMQGRPHNIVRHPDMPKEAFADLWATLRRGETWTAIVKNRRANGTEHYWVRANVTP